LAGVKVDLNAEFEYPLSKMIVALFYQLRVFITL
jgi:hypothetical protein